MAATGVSGVRKLLGYASALLAGAVRGKLTQAWAWATFRQAQEAAGEQVTGVTAADMSRLIGWTNKALAARDSLVAADTTALIGAGEISPYATYVLSPTVAESPRYAVQARVVTTVTGEETELWFWEEMDVTGMTKGQVLDAITAGIADLQAATPTTYGSSVVSTSTVTIYAI